MVECARWDVDVIITDHTQRWLDLRTALQADYAKTEEQYGRWFLWTTWGFYSPVIALYEIASQRYLEAAAGPFKDSVGLTVPQQMAAGHAMGDMPLAAGGVEGQSVKV
jgi:phosphatidylglycerol phospholipase C